MKALLPALLALAALVAGCKRPAKDVGGAPVEPPRFDADASEPDNAPSPPSDDPAKEAMLAFDSARQAMLADQDIEAGVRYLEEAIRLDPGFGEAWFQLSTAWIQQANAAIVVDEKEAVAILRKGVDAGKKSLELMRAGSLRAWNAFELREAEEEMAKLLEEFPDLTTQEKAAAALRVHRTKEGYVDDPMPEEPVAPAPES